MSTSLLLLALLCSGAVAQAWDGQLEGLLQRRTRASPAHKPLDALGMDPNQLTEVLVNVLNTAASSPAMEEVVQDMMGMAVNAAQKVAAQVGPEALSLLAQAISNPQMQGMAQAFVNPEMMQLVLQQLAGNPDINPERILNGMRAMATQASMLPGVVGSLGGDLLKNQERSALSLAQNLVNQGSEAVEQAKALFSTAEESLFHAQNYLTQNPVAPLLQKMAVFQPFCSAVNSLGKLALPKAPFVSSVFDTFQKQMLDPRCEQKMAEIVGQTTDSIRQGITSTIDELRRQRDQLVPDVPGEVMNLVHSSLEHMQQNTKSGSSHKSSMKNLFGDKKH